MDSKFDWRGEPFIRAVSTSVSARLLYRAISTSVSARLLYLAVLPFLVSACSGQAAPPTSTASPIPPTDSPPPTGTYTPTSTSTTLPPTSTSTATTSPTPSETPTITNTATQTISPTSPPPAITADVNLNCRYGPNENYLYAWGVSEGDFADLDGRNYEATWLWVKPHDLDWHCWVVASGATANVDLSEVPVVYPPLQTNPSVAPPTGVGAARNGSSVTLSWSPAQPAVDLAYLIEARICANGFLVDVVFVTTNTSYVLNDSTNCGSRSYGTLRVQNKLGYSNAVSIGWP